MKILKLL